MNILINFSTLKKGGGQNVALNFLSSFFSIVHLEDNFHFFVAKDTVYENKIIFHGAIFDEKILSNFFLKAFASISPDQAGLSVLKSMGYGVPYITKNNAFTGGERLNIINEYNGLFFENYDELTNIIIDIFNNKSKYINMGKNASSYYYEFCTPLHMAKGIVGSIEYAFNK